MTNTDQLSINHPPGVEEITDETASSYNGGYDKIRLYDNPGDRQYVIDTGEKTVNLNQIISGKNFSNSISAVTVREGTWFMLRDSANGYVLPSNRSYDLNTLSGGEFNNNSNYFIRLNEQKINGLGLVAGAGPVRGKAAIQALINS